ncbi:hypothetical protein ACJRO7_000863 [Eucalyptus globulus]|uniref:Uncharacterized protein n=1 Tax=Eucalyptus globulus TaxID=34317 RepID=A0ABD3LP11_EUCGL
MMSCKFGIDFPRWIRSQGEASEIVLSNASITGALPNWLGLLSVSHLDLSYNQIDGSMLKFSYNSMWLDLSHNSILGPIPHNIGSAMPNVLSLFLNDNLFSGPIPTSLCEMHLETLLLGRNELVGKIPTCWQEQDMNILDLSSNKSSGVIPSSLGNLSSLQSLHLNNNSLHGEIPTTMNNCSNLINLDLDENHISGSVPHWFGPSIQLQVLRLRENMFNGTMNKLTGKIPNCLGYMESMKLNKSIHEGNSLRVNSEPTLDWSVTTFGLEMRDWDKEHVEQVVKGIDLDYTTLDLQLMVNLDLSSNKLIGSIPEELTLLLKLRGLNLSHMESLESLDLSNNHLSGAIPQSFSAFTFLSKLNLSHNNFTRPIPKGNQIQTLDDHSIYANNPLLCGDPLPKKCFSAEAPEVPEEDTKEEGKLEKVMFYIVIMLAFATGLWGVIGVLVYKKNWRRVYFDYVDYKTDMVYVIVIVKADELRRRLRRA